MTSTSARTLATSLDKLSIDKSTGASSARGKTEPLETWEDEEDSYTETKPASKPRPIAIQRSGSMNLPNPPPPTPSSPSMLTKSSGLGSAYQTLPPYGMAGSPGDTRSSQSSRRGEEEDRRPEKTTSTASRLIAAGIGQAPPKRTKEQKEYDNAMKLQEKKKRDAAKEDEERKKRELEHARKAIWDD
ncbi:hypothetical protein B0A48_02664 [Cryoendolithus antarcticus]|uniref:Uncharacterized protein n=1 Tax=Cryoendolithus antarcticus TaxID=1507870 RepID=A0A1V8TKY5_9PEZI|nr:hypothetical protein B0A48_02664 [Cryoendolithus antarcticus]